MSAKTYDWRASAENWRRRALNYRDQMRELQKVISDLRRERNQWRRLASSKADLPDSIKEALNSGDGTYRP